MRNRTQFFNSNVDHVLGGALIGLAFGQLLSIVYPNWLMWVSVVVGVILIAVPANKDTAI